MLLFKRIIPFLAASLSYGAAELSLQLNGAHPGWWVLALAALPLLYQFLLIPKRIFRSSYWGLGGPLWLFGLGSMVVFLYIPGLGWQRAFAALSATLIGVYLETEFSYIFHPSTYVPFSMERLAEAFLALGAGMTCMGLLGIEVLALVHGQETFLLAVIWAFIISACSTYMYKLPQNKKLFLFFIGFLFLIQLYWVLHFLPITFVVTGAISGILIASMFSLFRYAAMDSLDRKTFVRTISTSTTAVIVLLLTSRWT